MKSFSVMPMDQHLSLKGTPLTDDAATLSVLGVRPGCLLMLKVCLFSGRRTWVKECRYLGAIKTKNQDTLWTSMTKIVQSVRSKVHKQKTSESTKMNLKIQK